jgi:hypothetical protein
MSSVDNVGFRCSTGFRYASSYANASQHQPSSRSSSGSPHGSPIRSQRLNSWSSVPVAGKYARSPVDSAKWMSQAPEQSFSWQGNATSDGSFWLAPFTRSDVAVGFIAGNGMEHGSPFGWFQWHASDAFSVTVTLVCRRNILQGRASRPFSTGKTASNSIQDPCHVGFLSTLNWSFVGRSFLHLLWPVLYNEETLRSLLKTL